MEKDKCILKGFVNPRATCLPGECSHCGWNYVVEKQRKWRLRQGDWAVNKDGLLCLKARKGEVEDGYTQEIDLYVSPESRGPAGRH